MDDSEKDADALDSLVRQNAIIEDLAAKWSHDTHELMDHDDVNVRWERGSATKFLLQHAAVREEAKTRVVARLGEVGETDLATTLEGDGPARRTDIAELDRVAHGHTGINLNSPAVDTALERVLARLRPEIEAERDLLAKVVGVLGPDPRSRGLPRARTVRMQSALRPSPEPHWYDRIGALKAVQALYDHLRSSPAGLTNPAVDEGREYRPGPRTD